jgi:hypothetical protein
MIIIKNLFKADNIPFFLLEKNSFIELQFISIECRFFYVYNTMFFLSQFTDLTVTTV